MLVHGVARSCYIAALERVDDRGVVDERRFTDLLRMEVRLDARPQLAPALLPETVDRQRERAVARRGGDAHVELTVGGIALDEVVGVLPHAYDRLAQLRDVGPLDRARPPRGDLALDERAGGKQFERARTIVVEAYDLGGARTGDEDARSDAHLDTPRDLERDDRFAHRRARDPEQRRELALGRQSRARRKFAVIDERRDLAGDLPVEPQRLDGMQ